MQLLDARCCGNGKLTPPAGALGGPAPQVDATVVPPLPVVPRCRWCRRCRVVPPRPAAPVVPALPLLPAVAPPPVPAVAPLPPGCPRLRRRRFPPRRSLRRGPPFRCCLRCSPRRPSCRRVRSCRPSSPRRSPDVPAAPDVPAPPDVPARRPTCQRCRCRRSPWTSSRVPAATARSARDDEETRRNARAGGTAGEHEDLQVKGSKDLEY